jgi:hypothetical protein
MHDLESAAQSILRPLIEGHSSFAELAVDARTALTRWLLKTAFFICDTSAGPTMVPAEHMQLAMRGALPDGLALFGAPNPSPGVYGCHVDRHWLELQPIQGDSPDLKTLAGQSYKFSIMLGRALFSLVYWPPIGDWNLAITPSLHEELWPRARERAVIPWSMQFPVTPHVLLVFHFATGVTERPSWTTSHERLELPNGSRAIFAHEAAHMQLVHLHSLNGCPYFEPSQVARSTST